MKKLPIGIQTLAKIIHQNCIYVDKTKLILRLIEQGNYYFLSRPRRSGKSLLVDTLRSIFNGEKELFKTCYIHSSNYTWQKHPIIYLDFTQFPTKDPVKFEDALKIFLHDVAKSYHKSIKTNSLEYGFADLVKKLAEDGKVVILVDEYDKPLIDNLHQLEVASANREILKSFFGTLKGLDSYLKFVFVTGVTKFSQVSLFSGFNNLKDITIHPDYATLLGYTENEVRHYFSDRIAKIAHERSHNGAAVSDSQVIDEMRTWYNGYRFSWGADTVYNPHSTLNFLDTGRIENYWFQTATPTFLINQIKKQAYPLDQISGIKVGGELFESFDFEKIDLVALMWQTGYLTIQRYDKEDRLYTLDYPNEEVRLSFTKILARDIANVPMGRVNEYAKEFKEALRNQDLEQFFFKLKTFFADIPYDMNVGEERYYQTIFYVIAKLIGLETQVEVKTNLGRIDMICYTDHLTYVMEFKVDSKAKTALDQINKKKYYEKYLGQDKSVILVGANFSTKERTVTEWKMAIRR